MKKYVLKLSGFLFFAIIAQTIFAQNLELQNTETQFDENTYPCIEVLIEPSPDEVKDAWEDFIKDNYDVKMKGNGLFTDKDVLYAEQVKFGVVSNKEMDFYTRIIEEGGQTKLCVFGSFGYDIPVSEKEYPNEYKAMETLTKHFLKGYLPTYYKEWINKTQEQLTDLQDDRKDMQEKMEKNKKEIEKLIKENKELEESLAENKTKIAETSSTLKTKKQMSSDVTARLQSLDTTN